MLQHTPADSTTYAAKPQRTEVMEVTMKLARLLLPTLLLALATAALYVPTIAQARSFPDVAKSYWDYGAINWVTNQGPPARSSSTTMRVRLSNRTGRSPASSSRRPWSPPRVI